jgi:hypothetical protein
LHIEAEFYFCKIPQTLSESFGIQQSYSNSECPINQAKIS